MQEAGYMVRGNEKRLYDEKLDVLRKRGSIFAQFIEFTDELHFE